MMMIINPFVFKPRVVPTTFNPSDLDSGSSLSNGNLTVTTNNAGWGLARTLLGVSSRKWYWEFTFTNANGVAGVINNAAYANQFLGSYAAGYGYQSNGNKRGPSAANTAYGASWTWPASLNRHQAD